jgi:hypothetical protein
MKQPDELRAFGGVLKKVVGDDEYTAWVGHVKGADIAVTVRDGEWLATASMSAGNVTVTPHPTSSSYPSALRNLRGHLGNLLINLEKMGIGKKRVKR